MSSYDEASEHEPHDLSEADGDGSGSGNSKKESSRRRAMHGGGTLVSGSSRTHSRLDRHHPTGKMKTFGLRTKFMVLMAAISGIGLIALGGVMTKFANDYLFGQTVHKGIEIAKMAAQVAGTVLEPRTGTDEFGNKVTVKLQRTELEELLRFHLQNAREWGSSDRYSDILAIQFDGGGARISGFTPIGDPQDDTSARGEKYNRVFIPRLDAQRLPPDVEVYELFKRVEGRGEIPVYRFRVQLNQTFPEKGYSAGFILVDIAGDTVREVAIRLYLTIGIVTAVMIVVVLILASLFASRITKPLRLLVRDMQIVAKGDLDHHTRPHSNDEVGLLANEFNRMTWDLKEAQDILVEQEKAAYELSLASEVQQHLLPAETPQIQGWGVASYYKGAKAVSGDYYDFIPLGGGLWGFIIADVSGKGIPGSMVMAVTRTIIRLVANKHRANAAETLKETNRLIARQIKRGMFVTAFYAVLDEETGRLTFASAGHNPMVVYRAAQGQHELASPKGIAIGFNEGPLFDKNIQQYVTTLLPGDSFVLYTDGFPEAMNVHDEEFGDEPFYESIERHGPKGCEGIVDGIVDDVAQHRGQAAQSDDLTVMVIDRKA
jgi:serine phosphatase RsbU (regulator of sigma subunit)